MRCFVFALLLAAGFCNGNPGFIALKKAYEGNKRRLQDNGDSCEDTIVTCPEFARPQRLTEGGGMFKGSPFHDDGFCSHPDSKGFMESLCPLSCRVCVGECKNTEREEVIPSCEAHLRAFPDACKCIGGFPNENPDYCKEQSHGGVGVFDFRRDCRKLCYENGDLPGGNAPCGNHCSVRHHPCTFPYKVTNGDTVFDGNIKCISTKSSTGKRPDGANAHGIASDSSTVKWCPFDAEYAIGEGNMNYTYCSCKSLVFDAPTSPPTPPPTARPTQNTELCSDKNYGAFVQELNSCDLANCAIDLDAILSDGSTSLELCEQIVIPKSANVTIKGTNKELTCAKGFFNVLQVRGNATLHVDGVSVRRCDGVFQVYDDASLLVTNSIFEENGHEDITDASPIVLLSGMFTSMDFDNCVFARNNASGGTILQVEGSNARRMKFTLSNSVVEHNTAYLDGGLFNIYHDQNIRVGSLSILNTSMVNNTSGRNGGILYLGAGVFGFNFTVVDSLIHGNSAVESGGVMEFSGATSDEISFEPTLPLPAVDMNTATFINTTISENTGFDVGVMYVIQTGNNIVRLVDCTVEDNRAVGSAVFSVSGEYREPMTDFPGDKTYAVQVIGGRIRRNSCTSTGGVFYSGGLARLNFDGVLFGENKADVGGVGFIIDDAAAEVRISNCTFQNNTARIGGVFKYDGRNYLNLTNCTFVDNYASSSGGVMSAYAAKQVKPGRIPDQKNISIRLDGCHFENNHAPTCGVFELRGDIDFAATGGTTFNMNRATNGDGGVICAESGVVTAFESIFASGNSASRSGGFVAFLQGSTGWLKQVELSSNTAARFGGALSVEIGSTVNVSSSTFRQNLITERKEGGGGAIAMLSGEGGAAGLSLSVDSTVFSGNDAFSGGAVFYDDPVGLELRGALIGVNSRRLATGADDVVVSLNQTELSVFSTCTFDHPTNSGSLIFETPPNTIRLHYPGTVSEFGVPSCDVLGDPFNQSSAGSHLEMASGREIPAFCVVVVDGFSSITRCQQDKLLSVDLKISDESKNKSLLDLPPVVPRAIALDSKVLMSQMVLFGEEGNYTLTVLPGESFHPTGTYYDSERFRATFNLAMVPCIDSEIRYPHNESKIFKCSDTKQLIPRGYHFPDKNDHTRTELCPLGYSRPESKPATQCYKCATGSVSSRDRGHCNECETLLELSWQSNRSKCDVCPEGAECLGGTVVVPKVGYYHTSLESYQFHRCLSEGPCSYPGREANLKKFRKKFMNNTGGSTAAASTTSIDQEYLAAMCSTGYTGPLCGACARGYQRSSLTECRKCSSKATNIVFFSITFFLLTMAMVFLVNKTFKKRDTTSNAIKIIVAFVQQISVLSTFRIGWPKEVNGLISFASGISSGEITSIGCLFDSFDMPAFLVKAIVTIYVVPLVLIILIPTIMYIIRRTSNWGRKWSVKMTKRNVIAMVIIVYFFLYPFLVKETIKLFACVPIDDGEKENDPYTSRLKQKGQYLLVDTLHQCWSSEGWHRTAAIAVGVPSLVIFLILFPLTLAVFLASNTDRFQEEDFSTRFGFVYVGMHLSKWYWFFFAVFRTSALAMIGMLITDPGFQNLAAEFWLVFYLLITLVVSPYKMRTIQNMEIVSTLCILTLLYYNMWMLQIGIVEMHDYTVTFAVLIIFTIAIAALVLVVMGAFAYVAVAQGVNPRELKFKDIFIYAAQRSKDGMHLATRKMTHDQDSEIAQEKKISMYLQGQKSTNVVPSPKKRAKVLSSPPSEVVELDTAIEAVQLKQHPSLSTDLIEL